MMIFHNNIQNIGVIPCVTSYMIIQSTNKINQNMKDIQSVTSYVIILHNNIQNIRVSSLYRHVW